MKTEEKALKTHILMILERLDGLLIVLQELRENHDEPITRVDLESLIVEIDAIREDLGRVK